MVKKDDISNRAETSKLNSKLATIATKAEIKKKQDEIGKLQTSYDLCYFLGKRFLVKTMMVLKICLFISKHLVRYSYRKTKEFICYQLEI